MKVQLKENLIFVNKYDSTDQFKLIKWHYYKQDEDIWCALVEDFIYPLKEIYLDDYCPIVRGKLVKDYKLYD